MSVKDIPNKITGLVIISIFLGAILSFPYGYWSISDQLALNLPGISTPIKKVFWIDVKPRNITEEGVYQGKIKTRDKEEYFVGTNFKPTSGSDIRKMEEIVYSAAISGLTSASTYKDKNVIIEKSSGSTRKFEHFDGEIEISDGYPEAFRDDKRIARYESTPGKSGLAGPETIGFLILILMILTLFGVWQDFFNSDSEGESEKNNG